MKAQDVKNGWKRATQETLFWFLCILGFFASAAHAWPQPLPTVVHNGVRMYSPDLPFEHIDLRNCIGSGCGSGSVGLITAESCGAVGDSNGTHGNGADNTTALQNCINGLEASGSTNVGIVFQAGKVYRITSSLNICSSSIGLTGTTGGQIYLGSFPSALMIDSATASAIRIGVGCGPVFDAFVKSLDIFRAVLPTGTATGIEVVEGDGSTIQDNQIQDNIRCISFYGGASNATGGVFNNQCYNGYNPHVAASAYGTTPTYGYYLVGDLTHAFASLEMVRDGCADNTNDPNNVCFYLSGSAINDIDVRDLGAATNGLCVDIEYTGGAQVGALGAYDIHFWNPTLQCNNGIKVRHILAEANGAVEFSNGWICALGNGVALDIDGSSGVTLDNTQIYLGSTTVTNSNSIAFRDNQFFSPVGYWSPVTLGNVTDSLFVGNAVRASGPGSTGCFFCGTGLLSDVIANNQIKVASGSTLTNAFSLDAASKYNSLCGNVLSGPGAYSALVADGGTGNGCPSTLAPVLQASNVWLSQEGSGSTLHNTGTSSTNTATASNVTWTASTGFPGTVATYNGTTSGALASDATATNFTGHTALTVSAWVNPTALSTGRIQSIFSTLSAGPTYAGTRLAFTDLTISWGIIHDFGADDAMYVTTTPPMTAGTLYHVCATADGSGTAAGMHVWINGVDTTVAVQHATLTGSAASGNPAAIGYETNIPGGDPFGGVIGGLKTYPYVANCSTIYAAGAGS